jgi:tetratricopeptide (TPR) repeat protein
LTFKKQHIVLFLLLASAVFVGCSTQKNTAKSRWWHSFTARYNTYYNGTLAYIDGSLEKEQGNQDNYTEMIPLYTVGNKSSRELGKANFDRAIEKCQKAIKLHSIKRRPQWTKNRKKTPKDLEWLNRREYNPFLWKAWMLMGRSQFYKGDFDEAASTFSYMSRLYQTQPAIYGRARAWLAKCYIEEDWLYDAEDVIRNMKRDSIHWRARKEWDFTFADYYIHTGEYDKAIPYLRKCIKHEMRRKQKAREWFLLGQLLEAVGNKQEAYKAYRHVTRLAPPYQLDFNAHIAMTEVLSEGQSKKMIRKLKRMAASDNNKDYLDQVYYAIGNIYLAQRDTTQAIAAYEKGNQKATRSGIEKGVLLLKLGDLYWDREKYSDAQRCYGEAIGLLDKERPDYEQLSKRSKVLDELVPYTDAVYLQDSLQALAKMDEKSRNEAIDRVIEALKKKEKEERNKQAEAEAQQNGNTGFDNDNRNRTQTTSTTQNQQGTWYFYNPLTVSQGKSQFQRLWGKRENVDDWQRVNKTVVAELNEEELTQEQQDSIAAAEAAADSIENVKDSAQNDPHKREYYLKQIPFTEEQVAASNAIIMDGLYNSGVIFKDKLDNLPLSEKQFMRLLSQYPKFEKMEDVYYHLFLLYSRKGDHATAQTYVDKLKAEYPESQWTILLTDPYFAENAREGVHLEDSLYAATYDAFKADRFSEVAGNTHISATRFPLGANRDKFLFIGGLSKLNAGDANGCVDDMKQLVEKFPKSEVGEMAGMIINGVNAGRRLRGGKFDLGNVWDRRTAVLADSDSINARKFSNERNTDFTFMLVYHPDSVNENQLLFQLARFNFASYLVRDFDITIEDDGGLHRMMVSGFRNYDEALQYARSVYKQKPIVAALHKGRGIIISDINLPLLGRQFSYDDYDKFYAKHFAPLKVSTFMLLTEPDEIVTRPEKEEQPTQTDVDNMLEDGIYLDNGLTPNEPQNQGTTIIEEPKQEQPQNQGTTIIEEPKQEQPQNQGTTIIEEPKQEQPQQGTTIEEPKQEQPQQGTTIEEPKQEQPQQGTTIEEPKQEQPQQGTTIEEPKQEQPQQGTTIEEPKLEQPQQGTKVVEPSKPDSSKAVTPTPKEQPKQTEQTEQPKPQPTVPAKPATPTTPKSPVKELPLTDEDYILPDDEYPIETPETPKKQPAKEQEKTEPVKQPETPKKKEQPKKQDSYELEDEYYDLEGF